VQVDFYHLTAPLDRVLPQIAEKVVASGARLLIVAEPEEERRRLDRLLWSYAAESFLPHGRAGSGGEAALPVLIAGDTAAINGARHVALVDGVWRDAALAFDRAFHFFDDEHIEEARAAWRALATREGVVRNYWKQNEAGRWEKAA
jgi:DNA polymerase-3 subunit chi